MRRADSPATARLGEDDLSQPPTVEQLVWAWESTIKTWPQAATKPSGASTWR